MSSDPAMTNTTSPKRGRAGRPRPRAYRASTDASSVSPTTSDLRRIAAHEPAHGVAEVLFFGDGSVDVLSIRPGRGHLGVCILRDLPADTRDARERAIISLLVGDIAGRHVWPPEQIGYIEESPDEAAAIAAMASLEPVTRERLFEAEEDAETVTDETAARRRAQTLNDFDPYVGEAHLIYLRACAAHLVERHHNAIRAISEVLLAESVLDGRRVEEIVHGSRCICHRFGRPLPDDKPAA
jgi:hypothetical protein